MNTINKKHLLSRPSGAAAVLLVPLMFAAATVHAQAAPSSTDGIVAERVAATLAASPDKALHDVSVSVHGGVVQLTGFVGEPREVLAATRLAKAVDQGFVVDNRLRTWSATDYE